MLGWVGLLHTLHVTYVLHKESEAISYASTDRRQGVSLFFVYVYLLLLLLVY
jgi:hypothetical protein